MAIVEFNIVLLDSDNLVIEKVNVGQEFYARIMARELHPRLSGLQGVALDINWDKNFLRLTEVPIITEHLPMFRTGIIKDDAIENLGGSAFPAGGVGRPIGNSRPEEFATLHFIALRPVPYTLLTMRQGASRIATQPVTSLSGSQIKFKNKIVIIE